MDEKQNTEELLAEVYRNVAMGSENLGTVVPKIKDKFMLTNVTCQMEKYSDYTARAASMLRKEAVRPEKISAMKKVMARTGIAMNTLFDSSDAHIADMIVKGTRMGADTLEKTLCRLERQGSDAEAVSLAKEVVAFERTEADKMTDFT